MSETGSVTAREMRFYNKKKYIGSQYLETKKESRPAVNLATGLGLMLLHILIFYLIYPFSGGGIAAMALLPICYVGWAFGKKGALAAGTLMIVINFILLIEMADYSLHSQLTTGLAPNLILVAVGLVVGHVRDINVKFKQEIVERVQAQEKLEQSEQNMKSMVDTLPASIVVIDANSRLITDANDRALRFIGMKKKELVGRHYTDILVFGEESPFEKASTFGARNIESTLMRPHKPDIPVLCSSVPITIGSSDLVMTSFVDISIQKLAISEMSSEKDWIETLLDVVGVMIVVLNRDGQISLVNSEACKILGFPEEKLVGSAWFESFIPPEIREEIKAVFMDIIESGPMVFENVENEVINADGERRLVKWHNSVMRDEDGNITHVISSGEDITEKRTLEKNLKASEERYHQLFERANDGLIVRDKNGNILDVNPQVCKMLGYSRNQLLKMNLRDLHTEKANRFFNTKQDVPVNKVETSMVKRDGTVIDIEVSTNVVDEENGIVLGIIRDITERKKAEESIRESEDKFRSLYESSQDAIMTLAPPNWNFTAGNPACIEMFDCESEEHFISFTPSELSPEFQPDGQSSSEKAINMILKAMVDGSNFFEWTHKRANGDEFPATVLLTRVELNGRQVLQATVRDITSRKKSEMAVLKHQKFLNNVFESLSHPFYIVNIEDHTIKIANSASGNLLPGHTACYMLTHQRDSPCGNEEHPCPLEIVKETGEACIVEHVHLNEEGEARHIEVHGYPIFDEAGNVTQMIEYCLDITEEKKKEDTLLNTLEELKESKERLESAMDKLTSEEKRFRELADLLPETIFESDLEGNFLYVNKIGLTNLGYTEKDFENGLNALDLIHPEDHERLMMRMMQIIQGDLSGPVEYRAVCKDGKIIPVSIQARLKFDENGEPVGFVGVVLDISEQKSREDKLHFEARRLEAEKMDLEKSLQDMLLKAEQSQKEYVPPVDSNSEELACGKNGVILFDLESQERVYENLKQKVDYNVPLLAIVRKNPKLFKAELDRDIQTVWLTTNYDENIVCVSPTDIAKLSMIITEFYKKAPNGCIMFEGGEYIISNSGFERFLHLVQILNDKVAGIEGTIALLMDLNTMEPKEASALKRECVSI